MASNCWFSVFAVRTIKKKTGYTGYRDHVSSSWSL